jgi:two-component system CheB/CheR fusion protein
VPFAVEAARAGAFEVLVLPVSRDALLSCVQEAVGRLAFLPRRVASKFAPSADSAVRAHLTGRQHEILRRILEGQPNKIIAADLGISQRTTENHRAVIMRKMGAAYIAHLIQIALAGRLDA